MTVLLVASVVGASVAVALLLGALSYAVIERQTPGRRRLHEVVTVTRGSATGSATPNSLTDRPHRAIERIATFVPKSPADMNRLRRRLVRAGYYSLNSAIVFALAELSLPLLIGLPVLVLLPQPQGAIFGGLGAVVGFLLPSVVLERLIEQRRKTISNGLPDVLDLLIVCLEAGCSLDQGIVKASEELSLAYPALGEELRMVNSETRAGKPRIEAFKNLEARTKNEDVRSLVAMLVQTDRFGTSISQALKTFAEVARTKRRQRAEERAAKISVKLVFPLVLCLFPPLYIVILGAAAIRISEAFSGGLGR